MVYDKFNLFLDLVGVGTLSTPTCATDKFKATTSFGHKSGKKLFLKYYIYFIYLSLYIKLKIINNFVI